MPTTKGPGGRARVPRTSAGDTPPLVRRLDVHLRPDPGRVIPILFMPGRELHVIGDSRAGPVIRRLLEMPEDEVAAGLLSVRKHFSGRYRDLDGLLLRRFAEIEAMFDSPGSLPLDRKLLAGACFTQEYAIEAAALFNPSMVPHFDQADLPEGARRFILTMRGVGEGHISSIEFRTGIVTADLEVLVDDPGRVTALPELVPTSYSKKVFQQHYGSRRLDGESADFVFERLPETFDRHELDVVLSALRRQHRTRGSVASAIERFEWMAASTYSIRFAADTEVGHRVVHPIGPAEAHGLEDVRMVAYTGADGSAEYRGTYTAFTGERVAPQLITTTDFQSFHMSQLGGHAARNKGLALFPRLVDGRELALARWDRESSQLAESHDHLIWEPLTRVDHPRHGWNMIQVGNCGSPLETSAGWLVLTHGVGPLRTYSIGALLLDRADPRRVIGRLDHPLLEAQGAERVGYVPNVVYSCGAMLHGNALVLPYGCSDSTIRFAIVDLPRLLAQLQDTPAAAGTLKSREPAGGAT